MVRWLIFGHVLDRPPLKAVRPLRNRSAKPYGYPEGPWACDPLRHADAISALRAAQRGFERSARRWRLARALLTRDHAEKTKISFELTCAAIGALGRALLGALGLMPITTYEKQAVVGADARGGVPVPLARPRGAQVAHGTRRTDRSDRAAVEAELPM